MCKLAFGKCEILLIDFVKHVLDNLQDIWVCVGDIDRKGADFTVVIGIKLAEENVYFLR